MTCVLAGYFGFGNAGDELIARSVRAAVPSKGWRVLEGVSRWNLLAPLRLLRRGGVLVFGGGELFQTRTSRRSLLYYVALAFLAKPFGARFLAYGMGLDPDMPAWAASLSAAALNRAERVWFRDEDSLALYRTSGGRASASVHPDPAWTWPSGDPALPASLSRVLWIPRSPRPASVEGPVLLLHPREDEAAFGRLAPREPWRTLEDLLPVLLRYDAVITMRYHGLVLAGLAGRPAVAVAAHGKVASLARAMGCPVLPPEASRGALREALEDAFARRAEIAERARGLRDGARSGLESLAEALEVP